MRKILENSLLIMVFVAMSALWGSARAQSPELFSQAELDQMLAPVALYPDTVLSHVLIAATYPLEVVQAARWSRANPRLRGEDAVLAVERMDWDPSVKALTAFPDLLQRMDEDLEWTQRLGDAFLMQEAQLLASIQYLRDEAYTQGHLRSNEYVRVIREPQYIYIEPAAPRVVYVPYYDPYVVYARWRWPAHPPVFWHHPPGFRVGVSFHWGIGFSIAPAHFYFSSFHWSRRQVVSVHHHHHYHHKSPRRPHRVFHSGREVAQYAEVSHWRHDPVHRRGVNYRQGVDQGAFVQRTTPDAQLPQARQNTRTVSAANASAATGPRTTVRRGDRSSAAVTQRLQQSRNTAAQPRTAQPPSAAATNQQRRAAQPAHNRSATPAVAAPNAARTRAAGTTAVPGQPARSVNARSTSTPDRGRVTQAPQATAPVSQPRANIARPPASTPPPAVNRASTPRAAAPRTAPTSSRAAPPARPAAAPAPRAAAPRSAPAPAQQDTGGSRGSTSERGGSRSR